MNENENRNVNPVPQQIIINQTEAAPRNGLGTAGFVISLISAIFCWVPGVNFFVWLVGLILSLVGVFRKPRGLAITGLVISCIDIIVIVVVIGAIGSFLSSL